MNANIVKYQIRPGDRILVPKSELRMVQHHALYLGQNSQGIDLFAENKIGFGVRLISADSFFKNVLEITRIERFGGNNSQRKEIVQKALGKIGKPYDLINYNCESFCNDVQYGLPTSDQAKIGIALGLITLFGFMFYDH